IYMCPWPRIQGAMMDNDTLTVGYRDWRGEPRGKTRDATAGDCVDCMACVNVCPMGIDIRDGQQMACITCALCIDACDDIMARTGRERGLIDYLALADAPREEEGAPPRPYWRHVLRPRILLYAGLWSTVGLAMVFALFIRPSIDATVAPIRNPQFVTLSDGSIRNAYDIRLRNKHGEDRPFRLQVSGDAALRIELQGTPYEQVRVPANETLLSRVYVVAPGHATPSGAEATDIRFWIEDLVSGERVHADSIFNGRGEG
ncbi:MAG: 4Fe-4S dicluster domain-containing protein, partial [Pseudomonadota bacterium]